MKKFVYISPSVFFSQSANSIQVIKQFSALSEYFDCAILFGVKKFTKKYSLRDFYNLGLNYNKFNLFIYPFPRFQSFYIFLRFLLYIPLFKNETFFYSRNIYASFFLSLLGKKNLVCEIHSIEKNINFLLLRYIYKKSKTVFISNKLKYYLKNKFGLSPFDAIVLHDASEIIEPKFITNSNCIRNICYAGSLYEGRGIDIIGKLAAKFPMISFNIYGGEKDKILELQSRFNSNNLIFHGFIPYKVLIKKLRDYDALLMPYQNKVSVGIKNHDTSKWMSPLKMFDYMASGVPIISSNLPVLREILKNNKNAFLCNPDNFNEWVRCIKFIEKKKTLRSSVAKSALDDIRKQYNWNIRAKRIINFLQK